MTSIPDEILYDHSERVNGRVVVITGAANGIGKEVASRFASLGARIAIGDLDVKGGQATVDGIKANGGHATFNKCNVTSYNDQLALFELAMKEYGAVDIVIANAGVTEVGSFINVETENGKPKPPNTLSIDVNLMGAVYTTHLAQYYFPIGRNGDDLKSLVLLGSVASWQSIPLGPMYTASKHAVLGLVRSMDPVFDMQNIRIACIHPFFADTNIVPAMAKLFLAGIPMVPIPRIVGTIFYSATNPDPATSGCSWCLMDNGQVLMVPREDFKRGVYEMIDNRVNALLKLGKGASFYAAVLRDIYKALRRPLIFLGTAVLVATLAYLVVKRGDLGA